MMYNTYVKDCFFNPQHVGSLDLTKPFTVCFNSSQKNQSMTHISLFMQCSGEGQINHILFKVTGNPFAIAAMEWLCRQLSKAWLSYLPEINYQLLINQLAMPRLHHPIAIQVEAVYKEILELMQKKITGDL